MSKEERDWVDEALAKCDRATEKKLTILLIRRQDANDEADIVLTNATDPQMVKALVAAADELDEDET